MKPLIIFGIGKIAEVVYYYAKEDCKLEVVAFTVDKEYKNSDTFQGLPVIDFESVETEFSPKDYDFFIAVGYQDLNALRTSKYLEAKAKGYHITSIVCPGAAIPKNVEIGENCFIMPPALIHPCVKIRNNVFIWNGAMVGHHSIIEDNCWLTSCCNISGNVTLGKNAFVAANATIGHSVEIGNNCFLGANTLVLKNLKDGQVVISEGSKPIRLNSKMFLRMSSFSNL